MITSMLFSPDLTCVRSNGEVVPMGVALLESAYNYQRYFVRRSGHVVLMNPFESEANPALYKPRPDYEVPRDFFDLMRFVASGTRLFQATSLHGRLDEVRTAFQRRGWELWVSMFVRDVPEEPRLCTVEAVVYLPNDGTRLVWVDDKCPEGMGVASAMRFSEASEEAVLSRVLLSLLDFRRDFDGDPTYLRYVSIPEVNPKPWMSFG